MCDLFDPSEMFTQCPGVVLTRTPVSIDVADRVVFGFVRVAFIEVGAMSLPA
jgi:hypothetical protein